MTPEAAQAITVILYGLLVLGAVAVAAVIVDRVMQRAEVRRGRRAARRRIASMPRAQVEATFAAIAAAYDVDGWAEAGRLFEDER